MKKPARMVCAVMVAIATLPAYAIVIRHDREDEKYRELATHFPAAVRVIPDGTGVLIAPEWVLTAAHVARGVARRNPRVEIVGKEYRVAQILLHPEWTDMGAHDIALLRLADVVESVEPIELCSGDEVGRTVTFVGSGDTGTGLTGPQRMDRVRRGATNVVTGVDEDWVYFEFDEPPAGTRLEGVSGPGDSGGGAIAEHEGKLCTLGVSVFCRGDGCPGRYGIEEVYTRVSTHREWVEQALSGEGKATIIRPKTPEN